jgi:hypothetical protein
MITEVNGKKLLGRQGIDGLITEWSLKNRAELY